MYCTCKSRKKCITNKFIEEINNSSPPIWSASILHNTGKPLKYMHTPCLYHQIKRDSMEILDVTDQNNSRGSDSLIFCSSMFFASDFRRHFAASFSIYQINELLLPFYNLSPVAATAWNKGKQENYNHNIRDISDNYLNPFKFYEPWDYTSITHQWI